MYVNGDVSFGPFVLSVAQRRLWHDGARVALKPKEAELLALLAERHPRTITKDEIIERLWRGGAASDAALTQTVYRLRRALGQYAGERDFIRTIPGIGFQFAGGSPIETRSEELDALRPSFSNYQRAVSQYRKRTEAAMLVAIRLLEEACREDPGYVPALVTLAKAYTNAGIRLFFPPQEAYRHARTALRHVFELDPAHAGAAATLGTLLLFFNNDRKAAHGAAERALLLAPQAAIAHKAATWERLSSGDFAAALTHADLAIRSGPSSQQSTALLGTVLYMMRRYTEAHACFRTARALDPLHTPSLFYDACTCAMTGDYKEARDLLNAITGTDLLPRVIAVRGYIAAKCGDATACANAIAALARVHVPTGIALSAVQLGLGDHERAAATLEAAFHTREPGLFLIAIDPMYDALRVSYPELTTMLQRTRRPMCDGCGTSISCETRDSSLLGFVETLCRACDTL